MLHQLKRWFSGKVRHQSPRSKLPEVVHQLEVIHAKDWWGDTSQ